MQSTSFTWIQSNSIHSPFGMKLIGRTWEGESAYRYDFNGKETDNESGFQDYGMRIYNSRLGRFLSVDPLSPVYPHLSCYQFAENRPIVAVDLDGLESLIIPRTAPKPFLMPEIYIPKPPTMPLPPTLPVPPFELYPPLPPTEPLPPINKFEQSDWENIDLTNPQTWPKPPIEGEFVEGEPSLSKARERGEKSWYDKDGGEWRPHKPDKYHPWGKWNYKPGGNPKAEWQKITPDGVRIPKDKTYGKDFFGLPPIIIYPDHRGPSIDKQFKNFDKYWEKEMKKYEKEQKKYDKDMKKYKKEKEKYDEKYNIWA